MSLRAGHPRLRVDHHRRYTILPTTVAGWCAVGLAGAFFVLVLAAAAVPRGAALGFVCGLAGGALALTAVLRDRERAATVFAALLPLVIAVAFVLVELITGSL